MAHILEQYRGFDLYVQNVALKTRLKLVKVLEFEEKTEDVLFGFSTMGMKLGLGGVIPGLEFETYESDPENFELFGDAPGAGQKYTLYKRSYKVLGTDKVPKQTIINVQGRILSAKADPSEPAKLTGNKFMVGEIERFRWIHEGKLRMNWSLSEGGDTVKMGSGGDFLGGA